MSESSDRAHHVMDTVYEAIGPMPGAVISAAYVMVLGDSAIAAVSQERLHDATQQTETNVHIAHRGPDIADWSPETRRKELILSVESLLDALKEAK